MTERQLLREASRLLKEILPLSILSVDRRDRVDILLAAINYKLLESEKKG